MNDDYENKQEREHLGSAAESDSLEQITSNTSKVPFSLPKMTAGLKTIISLSFVCLLFSLSTSALPLLPFLHPLPTPHSTKLTAFQVLAIGFLLVILSCALFKQYLPLLVVATYVLAPLPNWVCGRCANPDDFVESSSNAVVDFGKFCTGFLVLMGVGMSYFLLISTFKYICLGFGN